MDRPSLHPLERIHPRSRKASIRGVEKARQLAASAGVTIEVFQADLNTFRLAEKFDIIFSSGALHSCEPSVRDEIIENYQGFTREGGLHVMSVFVAKPFVPPAPDRDPNSNLWRSGALLGYYADADGVATFAAGSIVRGEGMPFSDLDLVVVCAQLPCAYRESFKFGDYPVELQQYWSTSYSMRPRGTNRASSTDASNDGQAACADGASGIASTGKVGATRATIAGERRIWVPVAGLMLISSTVVALGIG